MAKKGTKDVKGGYIRISQKHYKQLMDAGVKAHDVAQTVTTILAHAKAMGSESGGGVVSTAVAAYKKASKRDKAEKKKKSSKLSKGKKKKGGMSADTVDTPMGPATKPKPAGGKIKGVKTYAEDELEVMNRRDLAIAARKLGIDTAGLDAPHLRTAIFENQNGPGSSPAGQTFECDITGEECDTVFTVKAADGETWSVSPAVHAAIRQGAVLEDLVEGDDDVSNYAD